MTEAGESGVVETGARLDDSPEWLDRACHSMIDAVSALTVNLDYLAYDAVGERRAAAEDAKHSIDRILALAKAVRQTVRGARVAA
ncbi:MAG: hypothetical protein WBY94_27605 [Polyangiaceae bacterium]